MVHFSGDRSACKAFLREAQKHCVYILRRPDGRPFYVGKGWGERAFEHENEARHPNTYRSNAYKLNVIRAIWRTGGAVGYEIDFVTDNGAEAYQREAQLIGTLKRLHEGGPLTNLAAGGGSAEGPAPSSREKHSKTLGGIPDDNPNRAILNRFVLAIARMDSVVVKPVGQFSPRPTQKYPSKSMASTLRQAAALVASASANGLNFDDACEIPRKLVVENIEGLIENGVCCDIQTSGLGSVIPAQNPSEEVFDLSLEQLKRVIGLIGARKCYDLGLIKEFRV